MLTLSTPYQIEKTGDLKNFDDLSQLRTTTKRTEEGKILIQNKCVWEEMARYVMRRQLTSYLHPNTASAPADRLTKENSEHNGNTIKYLKSPSVERNSGDF